jgi:hypothetical protein
VINLGELAFTAEDFGRREVDGKVFIPSLNPHDVVEIANRILAEKLGRAPLVVGIPKDPINTHTARLVCVERIEK